jgi:pectinesterase
VGAAPGWYKNDLEGTFRYSESGSRGEGGDPSARVQWAKPLSPAEARKITPPVVLGGWDPRGSRN